MIGRWIKGRLHWYGRAADALSGLLSPTPRTRVYRGGNNAILVDREGKASTPQQRRKVVLRGKQSHG